MGSEPAAVVETRKTLGVARGTRPDQEAMDGELQLTTNFCGRLRVVMTERQILMMKNMIKIFCKGAPLHAKIFDLIISPGFRRGCRPGGVCFVFWDAYERLFGGPVVAVCLLGFLLGVICLELLGLFLC